MTGSLYALKTLAVCSKNHLDQCTTKFYMSFAFYLECPCRRDAIDWSVLRISRNDYKQRSCIRVVTKVPQQAASAFAAYCSTCVCDYSQWAGAPDSDHQMTTTLTSVCRLLFQKRSPKRRLTLSTAPQELFGVRLLSCYAPVTCSRSL